MSADPFAVLGLPRTCTLAELKERRRVLAKQHHPDRGGDPVKMAEINRAFDAACEELSKAEQAHEWARESQSEDDIAGRVIDKIGDVARYSADSLIDRSVRLGRMKEPLKTTLGIGIDFGKEFLRWKFTTKAPTSDPPRRPK